MVIDDKTHYVYKITDPKTEQFYFGSRSCDGNPENDNYMGSMVTWKPEDKDRLQKEIIKDDFETREDAIEFEDEMIGDHIEDPLNENYNRPHKGFHTIGMIFTEEQKEKIKKSNSGNGNGMYGRTHSDEVKQILRNRLIGKTYEELHGHAQSLDIKKRIGKSVSKSLKGLSKSNNHKKELSKSVKRYFSNLDKNDPKEIERRRRISNSLIGKNNPAAKKTQCLQEGCCEHKIFDTISECADYHNVGTDTISVHGNEHTKIQKFKFIEQ